MILAVKATDCEWILCFKRALRAWAQRAGIRSRDKVGGIGQTSDERSNDPMTCFDG